MGRRQIIAALLVLSGMAMLVGCGSSDDDGGADSAAASNTAKTEFINKANALCTRMIAQMQLQGKQIFNEESDEGDAPVFGRRLIHEVLIPTLGEEIQGIRALKPPAADEAQVNAILAAIQEVVDRLKRGISESTYPYKKAEALADKYGIKNCGQPSLNS